MRTFSRFFAVVVLSFAVLPLAAQTNELGARVGTTDVPGFGDTTVIGVDFNHFWRGGVSTKFGVSLFDGDLEVAPNTPGELDMTAYSGQLQYHFARNALFSPYVGAGLAFVMADLNDTLVGDIEADNEIAPLASAGIDVNITPNFSFGADATYMQLDVNFSPVANVDMDPLIWSAGVKFRW